MAETGFGSHETIQIPDIYSIAGERAGLRAINPSDEIDIDRMFQIEQSDGMRQYITDEENISKDKEELAQWIKDMNGRDFVKFFAVTASKDVDKKDHGEVEGWLRIDGTDAREDTEEVLRYERIMEKPLANNVPNPVELTYIKRPGSTPDLMAGALLEACHMIASQDATAIDGYDTDGDQLIPRRTVMAFVEPDNIASRTVMHKAGFECVKKAVSWDEGEPPNKDMFVLNWDNFSRIHMKQRESLLLDKLKSLAPDKFPTTPQIISGYKAPASLTGKR